MNTDDSDENKKFIVTAAQWGFDSMASKNETVSFIQVCIALEAILGDEKNKEGVTKMLADRCAFLLGRNTRERNILRENFLLLYDQRSKLVHGRQIKLPRESHNSLDWGRKVLNAIIRQEYGHFS